MARPPKTRAEPKPTKTLIIVNSIISLDALHRDLTLYSSTETEGFQPVMWPTGERHRHVIFIRTEAEFHDFALLLAQLNGLAIKRTAVSGHSAFQFCKPGQEILPLGHHPRIPVGPSDPPDSPEED